MNDSKLKSEDWNILMLYLEDSYDKLSVFSTLVEKLCAFVDIINNKLYKKQIIISLNDGFEVLKDNGDQIPLSKLSSGEQQIIVLYYDLIFSIENKTLLLIDEPEISLHVAWQRTFLEDLNRCSKLNNNGITAIVCTHSPQIIDSRWKKIIDLSFQNVK